MTNRKVFGIGFHKTGTKSLGQALKQLGYKVCGPQWARDADVSEQALSRALELAQHFDAFQDNPWAILYQELDLHFPGSKFILTVSPSRDWLARALRYFGTEETPMRQWIYGVGSPVGNEHVYLERYEAHVQEVQAYFRDRPPDDLLVYPLIEQPDWQPLCRFLDKPVPLEVPFPHANKSRA